MIRLAILFFLTSLSACASFFDGHEVFKVHMANHVGKKIDSSSAKWAREEHFLSKQTLKNGNVEYEYFFGENCRYFFEVEKETKVIIEWRYEGSKNDCFIPP